MAKNISIVCVEVGNYCGQGTKYVNKLYEAVKRNFKVPHRFYCFTDDPTGKKGYMKKPPVHVLGWWNKIGMFRKDALPEGLVIYFDLDTIIKGDISFLADYSGDFAILRDFYRPDGYGSGVMMWNGDHSYIWDKWVARGRPNHVLGDQGWMEEMIPNADRFQDLYPDKFVSYKVHGMPEEASVVCFHGVPKPHEVAGW